MPARPAQPGAPAPYAVEVAEVIRATPDEVWAALVEDAERRRWWPQLVRLDSEPGGRFEERWHDGSREKVTAGEIEAAEPERRLELSWADDDWAASTRVIIELGLVACGTRVAVRHDGWEALADGRALARAHEHGWRLHVDELRRLFER